MLELIDFTTIHSKLSTVIIVVEKTLRVIIIIIWIWSLLLIQWLGDYLLADSILKYAPELRIKLIEFGIIVSCIL